ncbi:excalibur calcium-binding domain-containing protein [Sinomonas sp. R1AF57]|uniref:excalibur calcium-binding domain-containing protein n=1 Tax=Sinomonas sp. R1AF57 TaxID=2020377 RepID=UPI0026F41FC7|nr:excalibur calcium-binding domain-containing protein [Sinomonas sp. R1AF57]
MLPETGPHDEAPSGPGEGLRERRERTRIRPLTALLAALAAGVAVAGLVVAPAAVLAVAAVLLCLALFWKSSARRSAGSGFVPTAVVWGGIVALVLALGAASVQGVAGAWSSALSGLAAPAGRAPAPGATTTQPAARPSSTSAAPTSIPATPAAPEAANAAPSQILSAPPAPQPVSAAAAPPAPAQTVAPAPARPAPSYKNCGALRAAGIATLTAGEAGYSLQLDRNGDGIACN